MLGYVLHSTFFHPRVNKRRWCSVSGGGSLFACVLDRNPVFLSEEGRDVEIQSLIDLRRDPDIHHEELRIHSTQPRFWQGEGQGSFRQNHGPGGGACCGVPARRKIEGDETPGSLIGACDKLRRSSRRSAMQAVADQGIDRDIGVRKQAFGIPGPRWRVSRLFEDLPLSQRRIPQGMPLAIEVEMHLDPSILQMPRTA